MLSLRVKQLNTLVLANPVKGSFGAAFTPWQPWWSGLCGPPECAGLPPGAHR